MKNDNILDKFFSKESSPDSCFDAIRNELKIVREQIKEFDIENIEYPSLSSAEKHIDNIKKLITYAVDKKTKNEAFLSPITSFLRLFKGNIFVTGIFLLFFILCFGWLISLLKLHWIFDYSLLFAAAVAYMFAVFKNLKKIDNEELEKIQTLNPAYFVEYQAGKDYPYYFFSKWKEKTFDITWQIGNQPNIKRGAICFEILQNGKSVGLIYRGSDNERKYKVFIVNLGILCELSLPNSTVKFFNSAKESRKIADQNISTLTPLTKYADKLEAILSIALDKETLFELFSAIQIFSKGGANAARGMLLLGPPGTGKSYIVKTLSMVANIAFYNNTLATLKSANIGGSGQNVKKLWDSARNSQPSIVFIDECDSIFAKRGGNNEDAFTNEIVNSFLPEWDGVDSGQAVLVVGATNRPDILDKAVLSRFTFSFTIDLPNAENRLKILNQETSKRGVVVEDVDFDKFASISTGMSGREIVNLTQKLVNKTDSENRISFDKFSEIIKKASKQAKSSDSSATWDRLILSPDTKQNLLEVSKLMNNYDRLIEKFGNTSIPRGILLYGPPGTGKTQIARTLANESKVNFIAKAGADIRGKYVGHSSNNVKQLFDEARQKSPCIIFIDEIDTIASRSESSSTIDKETLGELLTQMDGFSTGSDKVLVIAATNVFDQIDSALMSRFPKQIEIPLPGQLERERLFFTFLQDIKQFFDPKVELSEVCKELAVQSQGYSGRKIYQSVKSVVSALQIEFVNTDSDPVLTRNEIFNSIIGSKVT